MNKGTSLARGTQVHLEPRGDVPLTCDTGTTSPSHWRVHICPRVHIRLCSPRGGTNTRSGTGTGLSRSESALSLRESNGPVDESPKADLRTLGLRSPDRPVAVLPGDEQRDQLEGTRRRQEAGWALSTRRYWLVSFPFKVGIELCKGSTQRFRRRRAQRVGRAAAVARQRNQQEGTCRRQDPCWALQLAVTDGILVSF